MNQRKKDKQSNKLYELTLGYGCNSNCRFCSIHPSQRRINKTTLEAIADIAQAKRQRFSLLGLGGGEPTIRKDIIKLVRYARDLKFQTIRIQTNGIMLGYRKFCKSLVDAGANFFKISVHSHKAEIQDYLTRVPRSFDLLLRGIDNLHQLGIRIEANIVLNKINYKFLPQYINFFANKEISSFCIIFPLYTGSMALNQKDIGITISEARSYIQEALEIIDALGLDKGLVFNVPYCFIKGYKEQVVEEYNMKLIAPHLVVNDADADIKTAKIKVKKCDSCEFNPQCNGIWKEYLKIYGQAEFINSRRQSGKN